MRRSPRPPLRFQHCIRIAAALADGQPPAGQGLAVIVLDARAAVPVTAKVLFRFIRRRRKRIRRRHALVLAQPAASWKCRICGACAFPAGPATPSFTAPRTMALSTVRGQGPHSRRARYQRSPSESVRQRTGSARLQAAPRLRGTVQTSAVADGLATLSTPLPRRAEPGRAPPDMGALFPTPESENFASGAMYDSVHNVGGECGMLLSVSGARRVRYDWQIAGVSPRRNWATYRDARGHSASFAPRRLPARDVGAAQTDRRPIK